MPGSKRQPSGVTFAIRASDEADPYDFVLSDATVDRMGDIIEPDGWDLSWFRQNPIALFAHNSSEPIGTWTNVRVEAGRLLGRLKMAAAGTSARIDEIRALVEQRVLRAVSVGFRPLEWRFMDRTEGDGIRFIRQELLETSVVSVPANPAALSLAKGLNISESTVREVFGEQAVKAFREVAPRTPGEHASNSTTQQTGQTMTLAERIRALRETLATQRASLASMTSADTIDENAIATLSGQIEAGQRSLEILERAEKAAMETASPAGSGASPLAALPAVIPQQGGAPAAVPAQARAPIGYSRHAKRPADTFLRAAAANVHALIAKEPLEQVLANRYGGDEQIATVARAAVAGATTTSAGWAAELVQTVTNDFLDSLDSITAFPALSNAGGRLAFGPGGGAVRIPFRTNSPSVGGSFVGEGGAIPVRRIGLGAQTLGPKKLGVISVFSREIARYSNPAIEALLRREIQNDTGTNIDAALFSTTDATAIAPAGLLAGVTPITGAAGANAAAFVSDLLALRGPFDAARAGDGLVLVMSPGRRERLNLLAGPDGQIGFANAILGRYNPVTTTALADNTMVMMRVGDFVSISGDAEFDLSEETVLHMEDTAPAAALSSAGTPNAVVAPIVSMYQTAQIAIRMLMDMNWAMVRAGMVQQVTGITW